MNDMYAVFQRQLRVMRVGSGHKAVTAVEIALSGDAPMNAVNKAGGKYVVSLPRLERLHFLLRLFDHLIGG